MSDLREQLERLADQAPSRLPAGDLWARGRRLHRQRRVGIAALLVALVVGIGVVIGLGHLSQQAPDPAAPHGASTIPNRIFAPSGWLPSTDQKGPLGQLVAIVPSERNHFFGGSTDAVLGVSTRGAYRFLDLPDASDGGDDASLSPDGRTIAYWTLGHSRAQPHGARVVTGAARYDTVTGRVTARMSLPTRFGLSTTGFVWADDRAVVVQVGQARHNPSSSHAYHGYLWQPGRATKVLSSAVGQDDAPNAAVVGGYLADNWTNATDRSAVLRPITTSGHARSVGWSPLRIAYGLSFAPGYMQVAGVWTGHGDEEATPNRLVVGEVEGSSLSTTGYHVHLVPGPARVEDVIRWVGTGHVLAWWIRPTGAQFNVVAIDVDTGATTTVVRDSSGVGNTVDFATELLTHRAVTTPAPPSPWNPRDEYGWLLAWVTFCVAGFGVWRLNVRR